VQRECDPAWVWAFFIGAAIAELYFFLMDRAALQIVRAARVNEADRSVLLPRSYPLVWCVVAAKWLGAALIALYGSILVAIACLAVPFLASIFVPVPYSHFVPMFEAKLVFRN
jgi:hypothetical protein